MDNMTQFGSAVASITRQKMIQAADDANRPHPSEAEIQKAVEEAEFRNCFGHDAVRDKSGNPVQQGVGAKGRESHNHLAAIKKYEGLEAYNREVRRIWKETPDHAQKLGLPQPPRVGA
jgi:hypothetical protein